MPLRHTAISTRFRRTRRRAAAAAVLLISRIRGSGVSNATARPRRITIVIGQTISDRRRSAVPLSCRLRTRKGSTDSSLGILDLSALGPG
jgi:hypothetical protein